MIEDKGKLKESALKALSRFNLKEEDVFEKNFEEFKKKFPKENEQKITRKLEKFEKNRKINILKVYPIFAVIDRSMMVEQKFK